MVERVVEAEGLQLLGWRDVPTDNSCLGSCVIETEPHHRQVFIGRGPGIKDEATFERRLYILRKVISNTINGDTGGRDIGFYTVSLSCRTLVYKGMFLAYQLGAYYLDLHHPKFASALALVHQRFSTNTFPSWKLAHPYRMVAHNGEINTLRGNLNWMAARQASVSSPLFGKDIAKLWPISYEGQSDTACFDNALEFLVQGGYSLAHAAMMLIPEAWAGNPLMDGKRRAFYEYHACLMEPWDGPAAMAFTDGRQIGATLDRNGLRPARYFVTDEGLVVMASETGVLPIPEKSIVQKWRLQPGKMLLIDLAKGRIISDEEIKAELASAHPYQQWLDRTQIRVHELPGSSSPQPRTNVSLLDRQQAFGYTQESTKFLMAPMAGSGQEAVGSMGNDTPVSVCRCAASPQLVVLVTTVPLRRHQHDTGVDHLPATRNVALGRKMLVKTLKQFFDQPGLGQLLAEQPQRRGVRNAVLDRKPQKARERQPVAHLIFQLLVRQIVERLQNQHPEHQHGIKRLPAGAALLELVRREHHRFDLGAKALPRYETIDGFERIALR